MRTTCVCGQPVDGTVLCQGCTDQLTGALVRLADLQDDLELLHRRCVRFTAGATRRGEVPLPWSEKASELLGRLERETRRWVSQVEPWLGASGTVSVAERLEWLSLRATRVRLYDEATGLLRGAVRLLGDIEHAVDRPVDRLSLGTCGCGAGLYAQPDETWVTCWNCGQHYDVAARRAELLAQVEDMLLPAHLAADALTTLLGTECKEDRIRQWASRKRLLCRGRDARGRALYSVADVRALVDQAHRRRGRGLPA